MTTSSTVPSGDLATRILLALSQKDPILSAESFPESAFADTKAALDRLASRSMVSYETIEKEEVTLEAEGQQFVEHGSHEARVFEALRQAVDGLSVVDLEKAIGDKAVTKNGQGKAFKEKWISKSKDGKLVATADSIQDVTREQLKQIQDTKTHDAKIVTELKKRKLVKTQKVISFKITKGAEFALEIKKEETDLTADMIASGAWKTADFKPYNFKALGADQNSGALHPLNKVRHEFRQIFFEMGFEEMPTNKKNFGIRPWVKKIDTLAAEFPADTNYLYTTYNASSHDVTFEDKGTIILGSGVYRIGSSVEFDWCAVSATQALREMGNKTIMINYNPETYSTDFDTADKLYFEELSYERVMDIYELESASGVVVSVGGQLPQNIALRLQETGGANVLGTDPKDIDKAEDRQKFSEILDSIGVDQPAWKELTSVAEAEAFATEVGYPVLVRPSYVLSGAAMTVIRSQEDLKDKLEAASNVSPDHPVVITKFIEGAQEIDVDGVASDGKLILHAVSEHVEQAGVHSGDATLVLPPANLEQSIMDRVKEIAEKVAKAWKITGPFNMQIIKADDPAGGEAALKVIECNLRASRSFPFVSKVLGTNFIDVATKALVGQQVPEPVDLMAVKRDYVATKVPQFSWTRLAGADPFLGVEMASTGEIACFGKDLVEAYWASLQSTMNFRMPEPGEGLLFGGELSEPWLTTVVDHLAPLGFKLFAADAEVKRFIESSAKGGTSVEVIEFPKEDKRALREVFQKYDIRGVFNLARARGKTVMDVDYVMRRNAVDFGVPLFMEPKTAMLFAQCMAEKLPRPEGIPSEVRRWSDFIGGKPL
ncbi:hypothetical protein BN1708_013665 [Verticillium longisporum]|uniref:Carbamoyl phosphate synthase arginine-specific large chain, mitochondrial n=1 Tax=Verticillium longisporum TaxID=100787 RepID=A0A0G4LMT8_VERLO|nr:hypothetical protein BN1708_013665 [Verticillium longisporum]